MSINRMTYNIEDKILYEDKNMIVCFKESGVPVQSARMGTMDLESMLKNYLALQNPGGVPFVGVVHRLDQPVEGVLVFGKTRRAAAELNRQMSKGLMQKYYLAVTSKIPENKSGTLVDYLVKDGRQNMSCIAKKTAAGAKKAVLDYKVLEEEQQNALVEILLHTGRHHQIRVQFAHMGAPLLGDRKYGEDSQTYQSVALCAYSLTFMNPENGKKMNFTAVPEHEAFQGFSFCKSIK